MDNSNSDTIVIQLTKGYSTIIDITDADLAQYNWHTVEKNGRAYAARSARPRIHLHRVILERILGRALAKGETPDHVDNNPLNNRRGNLRIATHAQNNFNSRKHSNNSSGFRGVHYLRKKWVARISINGERIFLGSFDTPEDAHEAYKREAEKHFSGFARFE